MINDQRLLDCFIDLVRIKSLTYDERGVADYIKKTLGLLDVDITEDGTGAKIGGNTGNVIVRMSGDEGMSPVLLAAHMDTVEPADGVEPRIDNGVISSSGGTILGADDKAGCAVMIELLRVLDEDRVDHPPIEAVFTVAEEKGLKGAYHLDIDALKARTGFVMDGDGPTGIIITKAPFQDYFKTKFTGKAAHAGVEPERGISAIEAASKAISNMRLGRIDDETTANIGVINGGRAINIVADETVIEGEARSHSISRLKLQVEHMKECVAGAAKETGAGYDIDIVRLYDGFSFRSEDTLVKAVIKAAERSGADPRLMTSGGGSDTNVFNKAGIESLNISCGQQRVHTTEESIAVIDMVKAVRMLEMLLRPEMPRIDGRDE